MKYFLIIVGFLIPLLVFAGQYDKPSDKEKEVTVDAQKKAVKTCVDSLELFEGTPPKPFIVLSPISVKSGSGFLTKSTEQVFLDLKKKACKMGADAIMNYSCAYVTVGKSLFHDDHGKGRIESVPACFGTAIKWK